MTATLARALPVLPVATPPAARGLAADEIRLLVARRGGGPFDHLRLRDLPSVLAAGDVLVVNTSQVVPSALPARRGDGAVVRVHLSTHTPEGSWLVELRAPDGTGTRPLTDGRPGEELRLPDGGRVQLLLPHTPHGDGVRLWHASLTLPAEVHRYLAAHGEPIRYQPAGAPGTDLPQTIFATVPGSVEPPSAALGFTGALVARVVAAGVELVPIVLHCGVSSLEAGESPHGEWYTVSEPSARRINAARAAGGRIIAVGTTATRALETVADTDGTVRAGHGWTEHVVTPESGVRAIDGLLTGWHEPEASHLDLVTAVGGRNLVERSYRAAAAAGYLGHEHGDTHLILP